MKRVQQGIQFHHKDHVNALNSSKHTMNTITHHYNSHELDAKAMKVILTELFAKTLDTKKKQKENPHHHYEGTFVETDNIEKPPTQYPHDDSQKTRNKQMENMFMKTFEEVLKKKNVVSVMNDTGGLIEKHRKLQRGNLLQSQTSKEKTTVNPEEKIEKAEASSAEVLRDVLEKVNSLGYRGKKILKKLIVEIEKKGAEGEALWQAVNKTMNDQTLSDAEKRRRRRDLILSSPLHTELTEEDEDDDAAIEEVKWLLSMYLVDHKYLYTYWYLVQIEYFLFLL